MSSKLAKFAMDLKDECILDLTQYFRGAFAPPHYGFSLNSEFFYHQVANQYYGGLDVRLN